MTRRGRSNGNRRLPDGKRSGATGGSKVSLSGLRALLSRKTDGGERKKRRQRRKTATPQVRVIEAQAPVAQRGGRGFIWVWGFAVALAAASFVLHLNVRFDIIQTGYALSQAQADQRRLRLSQRELRLELATLKAPGRIELQAREDLGMMRPDHERIVRLGGRRARLALRRGRR